MVATVATILMELVITDQTKMTAVVSLAVFFILTLIGLVFLCLMKEDLIRNNYDRAEKLPILEKDDENLVFDRNTQDFNEKNDSNNNLEKEKQFNEEVNKNLQSEAERPSITYL